MVEGKAKGMNTWVKVVKCLFHTQTFTTWTFLLMAKQLNG